MFVKIVESHDIYGLEKKINEVLKKVDDSDVIKVSYQCESDKRTFTGMIEIKGVERWI